MTGSSSARKQAQELQMDIMECERCKRQRVIGRGRMCIVHETALDNLIERAIDSAYDRAIGKGK